MRAQLVPGVLLGLLAAGAVWSCAGGDDADEKPASGGSGGTGQGGSGGGFGGGGFSGVGATGGVGASGGMGASGGVGATGGVGGASGGSGGSGGDASLDSPADVSTDAPGDAAPDVEAGPDAGNCIPPADAGAAPDAGCSAGQYWNPCKQACTPCSDLTWLTFGDPAKVTGLSTTKDDLFPRVTTLGSTDRVVLRQTSGNELDMYTATAQGAGWTALTNDLGNLVNYPNAEDSGPVIIPTGAKDPSNGTTATEPFILFDSKRNSGKHQIFTSQLFKGTGSPAPLGTPVNQTASGTRDYNPAYAYLGSDARLYWISDRNSTPGLYTFPVGGGAVTKVNLAFDNGCAVSDEDLEPWVTPDGTVLFFSSPRHEQPNCAQAVNGGTRALFYTYMNPATGQQIGTAKEIKSVRTALETAASKTNISLRTPALSPGFCTLYFATDAHVEAGVDFDVYSSSR